MKKLILFFCLIPFMVNAQSDTSTFRAYNRFGDTPHKDVMWIEKSNQILVMVGDSLFNTLNEHQLENKIRKGNYDFRIVNNPDSIKKIVTSKIKSIMILEKIEPDKKQKIK